MSRQAPRRRKRRTLRDVDIAIGPNTQRLAAVRAGVRGVRKALDHRRCRDAAAILKLTNQEAKRLPTIDANTAHWLAVEQARFRQACAIQFGRAHRRGTR